jgi:hypothetical protein
MNMKIENPTTCEMQSVTRFLNDKNVCPGEIHRQIVEAYSESARNKGNMRICCSCSKKALQCVNSCHCPYTHIT